MSRSESSRASPSLHPDEFARRAEYCERHRDYLDATIARFDREVQFYVAYLELIERMRSAGPAVLLSARVDR